MLMRDSEIYLSGNEFREDGGTLTAVGAFEAGDLTLDWQYCNTNDFIGSVVALGPDGGVVLTALYSENVTDGLHVPSWYGYAWVDPPGTLRWKNQTPFGYSEAFKMPGFQNFPAIGAEGTIYFTSDTAALIALNSADGTILWSYGFDGGTIGTSPPAIGADGTIYFQDSDGYLDAVR
jgi:outer membrane protein assembly factor BamB